MAVAAREVGEHEGAATGADGGAVSLQRLQLRPAVEHLYEL